MWWHQALFHISTENFDEAVEIFDEKIKKSCRRGEP
jgi:hypothetical protein